MNQMAQRLSHLTLEEKRKLLKKMAREKARKSKTEMPLSEGQNALWVLHQSAPESAAYHIGFPVRIHNQIDLPALRSAFQALINRHASLRTTFRLPKRQAEPVQVIHGYRDVEFEVIDASDWDDEKLQEEVKRAYQRPFDLERGPVLRFYLFTQAAEEHVLLLNFHHIAFDFWSLGIVLEELRVLYSAQPKERRAMGASSLARPTHDYSDYMRWQADMLRAEGERLAAYWQQQLGGALPILNLPTDYARPLVQRYEGASQFFEVSQAVTHKLKEVATSSGTTLYTLLLAAFDVLLYHYTGQEDILVGSPTSGRSQPELTGIVGYLVNPVVLRANLAGNPTFRAFLGQMRQTVLDAMAHQDYPFPLLVKQLQVERDPSRSAVFQVSFALQTTQGKLAALFTSTEASQAIEWGGLLFSSFEMGQQEGQFDLGLEFIAGKENLFGSLKYDSALFEPATITRIVSHLQTLLEGIVANPETRVAHLPLLRAAERHQILIEWNNTLRAYPQDQCIHERFEEQVERTPEAIALVCPTSPLDLSRGTLEQGGIEEKQEALTYREFNERANQLAHYLIAQGVGAETLVGICVERSLEMVIGLYGILKAGGAYVPIDPTYPAERLAFMLEDSQTPLLLTQSHLLERLAKVDTPVICLDRDWESIAQYETHNPSGRVTPDNLAYCIYTSGSTGKPKGAMNNHHGIYNRLLWMQEEYQLTDSDHILQKTPFSFDVSVWEFFWPLMFGARLVVARPEGHKDPEYLVDIIAKEEITTLHFVPSMLQLFLEAEELERCTSLRRVICSGEALPVPLTQRFFERIDAKLHNLYGPTEAAIDVTYWECDPNSPIVPIGRPVANTQLYILDPFMQPVPIGVAGELYLGGVQVGRGYLNRPELTQQKFIPNPFGPGKLYKTGDSCRYILNEGKDLGNVEFLGRIDFQVKIRGFRIELGEIEAELSQLPAVREVVVVVQGGGQEPKRLVAYLVGSEPLSVSSLRTALAEKLPDYMVPAAFVQLEEMPLTPNGKVNRRALPAPDYRAEKEALVLPRMPSEELLAMIWQEVLGVEQVSIHDNFFELGGDSILAIRIVAKAKEMGMQFSLPQLFQHRTIYELARLGQREVVEHQKTEPFALISSEEGQSLRQACEVGQLPPLAQLEDAYPLTRLQGGMLFHSELAPDRAIYHDIFSYHLRAPFDEALLLSATQWLAARHPVLRTSLHLTDAGQWLQVVHKTIPISLSVEDIRHLAPHEQESRLAVWVATEKKDPFDWSTPPLWRFQVHRGSDESFNLTLSFHHIILDGWSAGTMMTELLQHYSRLLRKGMSRGTRETREQPLSPPLAIAFRDFVALEQKTVASEEAQQYWTQKLNDLTVLRLPRWSTAYDAKHPEPLDVKPEENEWRGHNLEVPLSAELSAKLKELAQKAGVPLKSVLLAAHLKVLSVQGNQSDVLTGLISNGRLEEVDGERVLGLFLNTLPFRLSLNGGSWLALAQETFKAEQELLPYRRYPYAELQRKFGGEPLFEAAFNFINLHVYDSLLQESQMVEIIGGRFFEKSNFTLTANFRLHPVSSQVELTLEYDQHELSFAQIKTIGGYYARTLQAMVNQPNGQYEQLSVLSPEEAQTLLLEWNETSVTTPSEPCSHQLFEEQVKRTPEAMALVFPPSIGEQGRALTYRELNARANQLAHYLLKQGLKPEMLVGLGMERSVEMVIGLLAVFKAGGAYLPLDPTYPQERLEFMMQDSGVRLLLTHSQLSDRFSNKMQAICLDSDWALIEKESPKNPGTSVKANHLAYCIYTSGSTGKPKGVLVEHRGVCNLAHSQIRAFGVEADSRVLQFASLNFDASISEIMMALGKGASLYLASRDDLLPGLPLIQLLNKHKITHITLPPTALTVMEPSDLPDLQTLIVAGEACSAELAAKWMEGRTFLNAYGPSEYSVCISIANISRDGIEHSRTPPIGRPIHNTQVYLLDPHLQPVPLGVPGELHVSGAGLARGYLNRPELTEKKFIANPFADGRLYKTGDLCRYLPDGNLEFLGRIDHQVKVRGFRIELGEIEAALRTEPSIEEAVVVVREEPTGKQLVAYVVASQAINDSHLRAYLGEKLPNYMIPSIFMQLEQMPLTPSRKIDRHALPSPEYQPEEEKILPRTPTEEQLADIWQRVLGREQIGINQNFFELGGHSLLAVSLMTQIHGRFGRILPLSVLFDHPTIEKLASLLSQEARDASSSWSPLVAIQAGGSKAPFFCVHGIGGNVMDYYELARLLGPEQPFYGLRALGVSEGQEPLTQIEEMASIYIKAIQTIQPQGPYQLGGWSLGGLIAFEMAQQLKASGEEVALLALIDSHAPIAVNIQQMKLRDEQKTYFNYMMRWQKAEGSLQWDHFARIFKANSEAMFGYTPQFYPSQLTLLHTSEQAQESLPLNGWGELAAQVKSYQIPGDHYTLIQEPYVQSLAAQLAASLL